MQGKKILFLFLALLLPICIFIFLKIFGKNEFHVEPLYQDLAPEIQSNCSPVHLPYKLNTEILKTIVSPSDSLALCYFKSVNPTNASQNQIARIIKAMKSEPLSIVEFEPDSVTHQTKKCVFFLKDPYDLVLVDFKGTLRGQYVLSDREEIDRLITEIDIILKNY